VRTLTATRRVLTDPLVPVVALAVLVPFGGWPVAGALAGYALSGSV
jgi:hypothetical protein